MLRTKMQNMIIASISFTNTYFLQGRTMDESCVRYYAETRQCNKEYSGASGNEDAVLVYDILSLFIWQTRTTNTNAKQLANFRFHSLALLAVNSSARSFSFQLAELRLARPDTFKFILKLCLKRHASQVSLLQMFSKKRHGKCTKYLFKHMWQKRLMFLARPFASQLARTNYFRISLNTNH